MSEDSSEKNPTLARRKKWWRVPAPKDDWGIIAGVFIVILALFGPVFWLEPIFGQIIPHLPFSFNIRMSFVRVLVELAAIGTIAAALMVYRKKFSDIGLKPPKWLYIAHALVAFLGYIVVSTLVHEAILLLFGEQFNANEPQQLGFEMPSQIELIAVFATLVVLTPLAEEIIFRGFLFKGFRSKMPFWPAAVGVSLLFGLVHGQWNVGVDTFVMSLVACYLVEKTGSLWPAIFLHVIKNGLAFLLVYIYNVG